MDFLSLVKKSRSYRSFDESAPVSREALVEMVECARFAPSGVNRQALKFLLSADKETNRQIQNHTKWAGKITHMTLPPEGHRPTGFIVILTDTDIAPNIQATKTDVGICAQTILLKAVEMGFGGCMIGAFDAGAHETLGLSDRYQISLIVAIGKPDEEIVLEDANGSIDYYRDNRGVHHVPKRKLDELIL